MGRYTIKDIQSQAEALKIDIDNIYRALNTKIGSSPEKLGGVPEWIMGIPDLPTQKPLTITPTIDGREFSTSDDLKYNPITVEPVTSAIDSNIQPENIKAGISILGVFGTLSGGTSNDFVVPTGMKFALSTFTNFPTNVDLSYVTDMSRMFSSCSQLTTIPQLNTSRATDMSYMFNECSSLTTIPQLDTSGVTNMYGMFSSCGALTTIPQLNTSNVTNMGGMFNGCGALTTIPQLNTSNVTSMDSMFTYCSGLTSIPLLDTSNVTNMDSMFTYCSGLTSIPQLDTSAVGPMQSAFAYCSSLTTIPQLDFSSAGDISHLFEGCTNLTTVPQMNTSNAYNMGWLFNGCGNLTTVEGIDFSGLTEDLNELIGLKTDMSKLTRFIVNGKINVSIPANGNIDVLTSIDYDSVKSILAAADRTDNTNAKTLAFNHTMTDQNGELAALVTSCSTKGWTITGLTLQ